MFIAFICGALCSAAQLVNYTDLASKKGFQWDVYVPDVSPFSSDHAKDLELFKKNISDRISNGDMGASKEVAFFGFSMGGKFAAKLTENFETKGLFLLDPVDGAPPFQKVSARYPLLLENTDPKWREKFNGSVSLSVVNTQLGENPGFGGIACVPKETGSTWFAKQLGAATSEIFEISGAGHLDVLNKPGFAGLFCPKGENKGAQTEVLQIFEGFLEGMSALASK